MGNSLPIVSAKMSFLDWPTPDGIATVVYIAGCRHSCQGCQSPELQDSSKFMSVPVSDAVDMLVTIAKENRTFNIVLSGGDPLYHFQSVQMMMDELLSKNAEFKFCIYTGFDFGEAKDLIHGYDFIKTGVYDLTQRQEPMKTDSQMVLASKNQKIFDAEGTLLTRDGVLKFC